MSDETTTTTANTAGAAEPSAAATTPTPSPFVGPDGKFAPDWKTRIPEDLRGEKCLDVVGEDFNTMVKNYVYTQKMRGKNTIAVPSETSSQMELDAFYEAVGRPKTAAEYKVAKPKDYPDELWNEAHARDFSETAWQLGLSPKQVQGLLDFQNQRTLAKAQEYQESALREKTEAEKILRKEWGAAYEDKLKVATRFIEKTTSVETGQRSAILELAGNNPAFIAWVAGWGEKTAESHGIDTAQFHMTPKQTDEKIKELMATPGYINGKLKKDNLFQFERIQAELRELTEQQIRENKKSA